MSLNTKLGHTSHCISHFPIISQARFPLYLSDNICESAFAIGLKDRFLQCVQTDNGHLYLAKCVLFVNFVAVADPSLYKCGAISFFSGFAPSERGQRVSQKLVWLHPICSKSLDSRTIVDEPEDSRYKCTSSVIVYLIIIKTTGTDL